jgi:predicted PurR-regulated permease PerM
MKLAHLNVYFFFFLLLGVGWATFEIFQPFLTAILAAAILAALFQRPYDFLVKKTRGSRGISAFLAILLVVAVIVVPLFVILGYAANEANVLFQRLAGGGTSGQMLFEQVLARLRALPYAETLFGREAFDPERVVDNLKGFGGNLLGFVEVLYQSVAHFVAWTFIMFFTLFYFFVDGKKALAYAMYLSPLRNEHEKLLMKKFISISSATLKGTLLIGIVQGFLGGVTFAIAGVPSAILWGLLMVVLSIIPAVGAGLVWLPAGLILLGMGQVWQGVTVLAVGAGLISTIDNILRPKLVGRDTQMHPLMIFFATLGGIGLFGFPGFIIGPIIVSLFLALWEIYAVEFKSQLQSYNE